MFRFAVFVISIVFVFLTIFGQCNLFGQERETAIIPKEEIVKLLNLLNNLELSVQQHEWAVIFSAFLDPSYANSLKAEDKWKNLEWIAKVLYPDNIGETPEANINRANSITVLKHFISKITAYKQDGCDNYLILEGVRTIEFDLGKKYLPYTMEFCSKENNWLLIIPQ